MPGYPDAQTAPLLTGPGSETNDVRMSVRLQHLQQPLLELPRPRTPRILIVLLTVILTLNVAWLSGIAYAFLKLRSDPSYKHVLRVVQQINDDHTVDKLIALANGVPEVCRTIVGFFDPSRIGPICSHLVPPGSTNHTNG